MLLRSADNRTDIDNNSAAIQSNSNRIDKNSDSIRENSKGIAMAVALTGGVALRGTETSAVDLSYGTFDGYSAVAISGITYLGKSEGVNVYLHGGIGFNNDDVAGRGSIRFGW